MAETVVDIKYGGWCSLVEERYPQLTNDIDIEIAQYKKDTSGKWKLIKLDPNVSSFINEISELPKTP